MLIGKRINERYKIIEMIGGGGMANVYLARDVILERYVAVKILRLDFANDEKFIRRFRREAESATSLVHPNIVNIYDVGEEADIYFIVMEYVEGETLKQYIQSNSPLPIEKTIDIMKQLVSAISHAHQNNIIHRDIKPQNILIDKKGNVKITDFGIAQALTSTTITNTNSLLGSVHYISPEQARGGMTTKKSDIYSLGIVMFEMLTGRVPFQGESAVSIALKHLQSEPPSPKQWNPHIPQSVENIILKATAKDPFYRYDDVLELEQDLLTCLEPDRLNEPPFQIPEDTEPTKAIPIIRDEKTKDVQTESKQLDIVNDNKEEQKTEKKRKKWPIVIASLSILIVAFSILAVTVFPKMFGPDDVEIPDLTGKVAEDAIEELESLGLEIGSTTKLPSDEIPENHVIRTDPKAGRSVKEGAEIHLFISSGKEKIVLSDYTGRMYDEVLNLLKPRNFKDIKKVEVFDSSEPGTILDQQPESGEEIIPEETELIFTVSKGEETFILADLTNYSVNALKEYADSNGITINMTEEDYHDTIPAGYVISQDIEAGTEIKKGDTVNVVMSKGKEPFPPKTATIQITIPYTGDEENQTPQSVQIFVDDLEHDFTNPIESFNITETKRHSFTIVVPPDSKARYQVVVDGFVIIDEEVDYSDL
ncbi:Stk1 family PASTA domain-containing Ser/Thr kinase [Fervidibacillus halotolerans]|uniref:Serine/threonine-protein kinase PrkC n=1 Tax=Fervidibacillus halotolerans TaxID=2980027 RepID=A0A9E8RZ84_9BACI|nr:Stk1 family PASTA domain-containing Ser/Thr kinase [Fervidibacillus halotolerans]WAA13651.1 Stk1 family PASTA domain-containing Ser/Thr kinase [Fervidibacillus halotolerans]